MLTERQKAIYDFIVQFRREEGCSPSIPEIQREFAIRSPNGVAGHLLALESKGLIQRSGRGSRQINLTGPLEAHRSPVVELPLFGQIPAGLPETMAQAAEGCVSMDESTLGFRPREGAYALRVRGESMKDAGILDGDLAVIDSAITARAGQVVAALIDGESTLKRLVRNHGKWYLKAENQAYPALYPKSDLTVQGVVRAIVRKLS